jgi:hypothetical protein
MTCPTRQDLTDLTNLLDPPDQAFLPLDLPCPVLLD